MSDAPLLVRSYFTNSIPPRLVRMIRAGERVRCPRGHKFLEAALVWPHGCLRCTQRVRVPNGKHGICGEFVYLRDFRDGTLAIVEVDWREAHHMARQHLSVDAVAEFLSLPWTSRAA